MTASVFRCFSSQASPICGTMPRRNKGSDEEEGLSNWKEEGKWGEEGKGEWKEEGKWIWVVEEGKEKWKEDWKWSWDEEGKGEWKEDEKWSWDDEEGKGEWKEDEKWSWGEEGKGECKEEEATVISDDDGAHGADGAFPESPGDGSHSDVPEPAGDSDEDWGHWKAPQGRIFNKNRSSISSLFDSSMSSMF